MDCVQKKKKLKTLNYLKIQIYNQKKTEKSKKCLVQLKSIFLRIITHCCISLEKKKKPFNYLRNPAILNE